MNDLETAFHEEMIELYRRAKIDAGYNATYFLGMLGDIGGPETAHYLVNTKNASDGYVALWELGRLDLTVEAAVLDPRWHDLFSDAERAIARDRLMAYQFDVDAYRSRMGWAQ